MWPLVTYPHDNYFVRFNNSKMYFWEGGEKRLKFTKIVDLSCNYGLQTLSDCYNWTNIQLQFLVKMIRLFVSKYLGLSNEVITKILKIK
jgi:hypothetical protein